MGDENIISPKIEESQQGSPKHATGSVESYYATKIPGDLIQMFGIDEKTASIPTMDKLRDIARWALDGEMFVGDGLVKVREMLDKIPSSQKDKHVSVWNLIAMQKKIDEKRKEVVDLEKRKIAIYGDGRLFRHPATL